MGELSRNPPCLWTLVWPSCPCFIPNWSGAVKWAKLGIVSWNWATVQKICRIVFWQGVYAMKDMMSQQWRCRWGQYKIGDENSPEDQFTWENQVQFPFSSCILFSSWLLISSPVSTKLGLTSPSLGYFKDNEWTLVWLTQVYI
jgi:hypothetical protein